MPPKISATQMMTGDSKSTSVITPVEGDAEDRRREKGDEHAEDEALGPPARRQVAENLHDLAGIDRKQRQDRAELDEHLERLARALEAENAAGEQKVRRRGDRQELRQSFDDPENKGVDDAVELHCAPTIEMAMLPERAPRSEAGPPP